MVKRFNPPPNWPQPPLDWKPGPEWQPDPRWPPPPRGWQLWVDDDPGTPGPADTRPPQSIFISYRRSDCQSQANALTDGLRFRVPEAEVFMDIDAIPPGVDFEEHIRGYIERCDLVLVMIGDNWLDRRPETGSRRIDEPEDFVRLEIESAFKSPRCTVIPVLVEGAAMPRAEDLPESVRRLARINAVELSDQRWHADVARLSEHIETRRQEALRAATKQVSAPVQDSGAATTSTVAAPSSAPPWAPPPPYARPSKVGWWMVALAFFTCGLASFAPAVWAANRRRDNLRFRKWAFLLAGIITMASLIGLGLAAAAPTDSEGNSTGPLAGVGGVLIIACLVASTGLAIYAVVTDKNRTGTG